MWLIDLLDWVKTHRILVVISMASGTRYEIDGRLFRGGVYTPRLKNREKIGRKRVRKFYLRPSLQKEEIKDIWVYLPSRSYAQHPSVEVLEGAMEKFPKKTSKKTLREYFIFPNKKEEI